MSAPDAFRVSVVIPAWNAAAYVGEAIESVLSQSEPAFEIIVVDDGSTDETARVVRSFAPRAVLFEQGNAGPGAATNRGLSVARGDFFGFLDADDLWTRDKLRLQRGAFAQDGRLEAVYGHVEQFFSPELDEETRRSLRFPSEPMPGLVRGAMVVTRRSFERVGDFRPAFGASDFIDWYARAGDTALRSKLLPDVVLKRRVHASNMGRQDRKTQRENYLRALRATIERRRRRTVG